MIVTGCQRSGTQTISKIFGIHHEMSFGILALPKGGKEKIRVPTFENITTLSSEAGERGLESEASWMARPFIAILTGLGIPIIHLVRHPLGVISSIHGGAFWDLDVDSHGRFLKPYREFIEEHLPGIKNINGSINKSVYYYIYWNKPLHTFPRIQIESIENCPVYNSRPPSRSTMKDIEKETTPTLYSELEKQMEKYNYA